MHHYYEDILERIASPPNWFDAHGTPRWGDFSPSAIPDVYAKEAVLLAVECQNCGRAFEVSMTQNAARTMSQEPPSLAVQIKNRNIHYGDPPNVGCCAGGPTMSSIPRKVLQYWSRGTFLPWERDGSLEIDVTPDWAIDDQDGEDCR